MQINLNEIKYLCKGCDFDAMPSLPKLAPFSKIVCDFFSELSSELMKKPEAKQYSDVVTFGFFCRKSNINHLKEEYNERICKRLGRGVSFHIAPSNVPINFAYSLVAALLAGNACIVRASTKPFRQIDFVCECINTVLEKENFKHLAPYISVIRYSRSKEINDYISSLTDVRIIWGGDNTIKEIRQSPLPPRSVEIAFADRYSIAVIRSETILEATDLKQLARDFYNDTYLYDQNACSSPRLIYWLGDESKVKEASEKFWNSIHEYIRNIYKVEPVIAVDKYTASCRMAMDFGAEIKPFKDNLINRIKVNSLKNSFPEYRCAGGSFIEYNSDGLEDLTEIITRKYQTLSYYGIDKNELANFVISNGLSGIDRIVPIGKTSDFSLTWDGYDLIIQMSRVIDF